MATVEEILESIRQTKEIMLGNMDKLFQRGEKLKTLRDKTESLESKAKLFAEEAQELQVRAKMRYLALTFILAGLCFAAVYTIIAGFPLPWVIASMAMGGAAGYGINLIVNGIVDVFVSPFHSKINPIVSNRISFSSPDLHRKPIVPRFSAVKNEGKGMKPTVQVADTSTRSRPKNLKR